MAQRFAGFVALVLSLLAFSYFSRGPLSHEGSQQEQRLDATDWTAVQKKVREAIDGGYFPGCVLGVFTPNTTLYKKAFGSVTATYGAYSPPVNVDMFFDLNYLTQVVGINTKYMRMYDEQRLNVTDKVSRWLLDFDNNGKRNVTIQNLMMHNSGLQTTYAQDFGQTPADLLKKIDNLPLEYKLGTKMQYSELAYIVLGQVITKKDNTTLPDALFQVMVEAGLRDTKWKPSVTPYQIAPSGYNNGVSRGLAGNKIANFLNSTAGHSGMYSNLDNVGKLMQLLLHKGKLPLSGRVFSEEVVELFTNKIVQKTYNSTRAHGWDTVPLNNPPCGSKFGPRSFGMSDPSGSYIWADKDKNVSIVLLANGQFPVPKFSPDIIQGQISDAIMTALGY